MFFKNFDFLSPKITLYFKGKKRHLSPLGGFLSIVLAIAFLYMIFNTTIFKVSTNSSSLLMFRNFDIDKSNNYFNESGLFLFFWIYHDENILNNYEFSQLNNFKNGIIRIYMTYSYDKNEYNSSNLKDNDHWVYDTCHNYPRKEDLKYDYSFSSCIKYYYNSIDKKYYSIHDTFNFKWPYIRENITDGKNKNSFATFVEKCSNNSVLSEILGSCYSEEKINEYLSIFNKIFISFTNNNIEINNKENKITQYSYKIYNNIINNGKYFYSHELEFIPFNYEERQNLVRKNIKYNSFLFDGDRTSKIYNDGSSKLLLMYKFNFKKYINEFRKPDNSFLEAIHRIGGAISLLFYIFYYLNYILNKRIEVRNFQKFLNDKNEIIHKHINYERNKMYTIKSNIFTNISNEIVDQYKTFKSTYLGNAIKNDTTNINNTFNNTKMNENNFTTTNNEKIKGNEKENIKKSENIIFINNGTFMNDGNASSNKKLTLNLTNTIERINSLKIETKKRSFETPKEFNKTLTYTRNKPENKAKISPSFGNNKSNNSNGKNNSSYSKSKKRELENIDISNQKILDNSSISLLNYINKTKNINANNPNYNVRLKKEIPFLNFKKNIDSQSPKSPKNHKSYKNGKKISAIDNYSQKNYYGNGYQKFDDKNKRISNKDNFSQNDFYYHINLENKNIPIKDNYSQNINYNYIITQHPEYSKNIITKNKKFSAIGRNNDFKSLVNLKKRRQSYQQRNTFRKDDDSLSKISKSQNRERRKTGVFNIPIEKRREQRFSLFSRNSNVMKNNFAENYKSYNNIPFESYSQNNLSRNLIEHYRKMSPIKVKKNDKEIISPSSELRSKNQKKENKNSLKFEDSAKQNNDFVKIVQNIKLSLDNIWRYLCICRTKKNDGINMLNKFRHKLLSEEYLYILHLNMFIFKQKLGCKSNLEKVNLLEELYNDF